MVTKPADAAVGCTLNTSVNVGKVNTVLPVALLLRPSKLVPDKTSP